MKWRGLNGKQAQWVAEAAGVGAAREMVYRTAAVDDEEPDDLRGVWFVRAGNLRG